MSFLYFEIVDNMEPGIFAENKGEIKQKIEKNCESGPKVYTRAKQLSNAP